MKQKEILFILSSALLVTIIWVAFNIYHNAITSTISETLAVQIIPIPGKFDTVTIEKLKKRQKITPLYSPEKEINKNENIIPSITISPSQESTASAINIASQSSQASRGGELNP